MQHPTSLHGRASVRAISLDCHMIISCILHFQFSIFNSQFFSSRTGHTEDAGAIYTQRHCMALPAQCNLHFPFSIFHFLVQFSYAKAVVK